MSALRKLKRNQDKKRRKRHVYITIPDAVAVIDFNTKKPVLDEKGNPQTLSFNWWLQQVVMRDQRWTTGYPAMKSARKVDDALSAGKAGEAVFLEEADYNRLKEIVDEPQYLAADPRGNMVPLKGYENPLIARNCFAFIEAIHNATTDKPADPPAKESAP